MPAAIPLSWLISPSSVDVTDAETVVSATLSVSSGHVASNGSALIYFWSPTGDFQGPEYADAFWPEPAESLSWDTLQLVGATMTTSLTIPRYLKPEKWQASVSLIGSFGELTFGSADSGQSYILPEAVAPSLEVVNRGLVDEEAPIISEETVSRATIDVTQRSETVEISVRVADRPSGVSAADVIVTYPVSGFASSPLSLVSGTVFDGTCTAKITTSRNWPTGIQVLGVRVYDRLGRSDNRRVSTLTVAGGGGYYEWAVRTGKEVGGVFSMDERL